MTEQLVMKNSKGKKVSLCFLDSETVNNHISGLSDDELIEFYHDVEKSAKKVIETNNKTIARCIRANTKLETLKGTDDLIAKNQQTIDDCHDLIIELEKEKAWWTKIQNRVAQQFGVEDEDEED